MREEQSNGEMTRAKDCFQKSIVFDLVTGLI